MLCQICGRELKTWGKVCSRVNGKRSKCRIKLDGIKRRESGRLRKANMTPEKYARLQAQKKADRARARQDGRAYIEWDCVTCGERFKSKRYSDAGYWCSQRCQVSYWSKGIQASRSKELALRAKVRPKQVVNVITGGWFMAGSCCVCNKKFVSKYLDKTCSPRCQRKNNRRGQDWITPRQRQAIYKRDRWVCWLCNKSVDRDAEYSHDNYNPLYPSLDHVIPRSQGGTDEPDNLRLAHVECNSLRGAPDPSTYGGQQHLTPF